MKGVAGAAATCHNNTCPVIVVDDEGDPTTAEVATFLDLGRSVVVVEMIRVIDSTISIIDASSSLPFPILLLLLLLPDRPLDWLV